MPRFHVLCEGRRHEAKLFPESMTDLVERHLALRRGTQQLTVVFDKGKNSAENLQYAVEQLKLAVVGSLVAAHHPDLTGVRLSRYQEEVDGKPVFRTDKEVFGIPAAVAVIDQLRAEVKAAFAKHQSETRLPLDGHEGEGLRPDVRPGPLVLQLMNLRARQAGLVMSKAVLREELSGIREVAVTFSPAQVVRRVTRMSPIQEKLFEAFSLSRVAPIGNPSVMCAGGQLSFAADIKLTAMSLSPWLHPCRPSQGARCCGSWGSSG